MYNEVFLAKLFKRHRSLTGPKCPSGLFYDLDVCHRDDFNTCFPPRAIRPQLTNNMVLFSANGTNSSILSRGDDFATYILLSEPVPIFSTRISDFHVSTAFFLYSKKYFSFKKVCYKCEQFFSYLLEVKESLSILVLVINNGNS